MQYITEEEPSPLQHYVLNPLWYVTCAIADACHTFVDTVYDADARLTHYLTEPEHRMIATMLLTTFIVVALSHMFSK